MSLSKISPSNREREFASLYEIFQSINKKESVLFNSGAGAGKTYALIECLKYVIRNYEKNLKQHNQHIICITYTNVATKEVKERLGNTDLALVSTIHERIWALIKDYRRELVEIHKEKLDEEISKLEQKMKVEGVYEKYHELNEEHKEHFQMIMVENKDLYYQKINDKAADFKKSFEPLLIEYSELLRNVGNFKKIVNALYKLNNYRKCCECIEMKKKGYKKVEYNSLFNNDQLHKMRISHDSLLDYGLKLIEKYDLLKQIIIDKYPFIFIDEYQDTNEKIVLIMSILEKYSKKIGHNIFIGYFGDVAQNIYDDGVGNRITEIHSNLKLINKEFNRRSTKEVLDIINKIRRDNIEQISIYDDCEGGSVEFYKGTSNSVRSFIEKYVHEWNVTLENPLHCLVLTNKIVAEYSGFLNIYETFRDTEKYTGYNYNQLNTELLSHDLSKLGEVSKLLFNIVKLHNNIMDNKTSVIEISSKDNFFEDMNLKDLRKLISCLKEVKGNTLGEYINSISILYSKNYDEKYKDIIDWIFGFKNITSEFFKNYLLEKLFPNISDHNIDHANITIQKLLDIDINEYELWYKFLIDKQEKNVIYHTYHGTKGLEFDNVIIILENSFGKSRNYFNFFFENIRNSDTLDGIDKQIFEKIKNLLYVSCSRAIKNLRIIYIDDVTNFESGIMEIFGEIYTFE